MENLVHSLEHGRITVQYGPDVPDEVVGSLKAMFDEDPVHMILVPPDQSGMEYAVAATAWTDEDEAGPSPRTGSSWAAPGQPARLRRAPSLPRLLPRPRPQYVPERPRPPLTSEPAVADEVGGESTPPHLWPPTVFLPR